MKTTTFVLTLLLTVALLGCGGGHAAATGPGTVPAPSPKLAAMSHTAVPAMHIHAVSQNKQTAFSVIWGGLFPTVYAQSNITIAVSQNWEGACMRSPQPGTGQAFVSYPIFGLGESNDATCLSSFNDTDGSVAAANAQQGKLVFGAGTLGNLLVSTDKGTNIVSSGVPIKLWIVRSGSVTFTGVTCTLPSGAGELLCQGTGTFAAQNLDRVIVTATKGDADVLINLTANFTKALP